MADLERTALIPLLLCLALSGCAQGRLDPAAPHPDAPLPADRRNPAPTMSEMDAGNYDLATAQALLAQYQVKQACRNEARAAHESMKATAAATGIAAAAAMAGGTGGKVAGKMIAVAGARAIRAQGMAVRPCS